MVDVLVGHKLIGAVPVGALDRGEADPAVQHVLLKVTVETDSGGPSDRVCDNCDDIEQGGVHGHVLQISAAEAGCWRDGWVLEPR